MRRTFFCLLFLAATCWQPSSAWAGPSNSLLDLSPDGNLLLVANPDNNSVTVVDLKERKALREIKVGDKPEGVTWIGAGPLAAVTVYREDAVVFFDAGTGAIVKRVPVFDEPYGIIANKAGTRVWVTLDYPGAVVEIDPRAQKVVAQHQAGSFVRGLSLNPDESRLYVSEFYTGILRAVDPATGKVLDSWVGHAADNLARHVLIHPLRPKAYLAHIRSKTETIDGSGSIFPQVSICDLLPAKEGQRRRASFAMDTFNSLQVPTGPWESAMSPDGKLAYFIYNGTNDMNLVKVIDDDYREMEPVGGLIKIGQMPRAIRLSADGKQAYIYNTMDFEVGIYNAANMQKQGAIKVCDPPKTPAWVRGKILFNTALPPLTSRRWIACASCHPDGHHDGRVWHNPEGLRKVPSMFGMGHTHPLHWSADRDEVQDFEYTIRGRLMKGAGLVKGAIKAKQGFQPTELEEKLAGRSADLDALAIYSNSFEVTTLSPHIPAPGQLSPAAERGKKLFFDATVACASCHSGPYYTDSRLQKPFQLHDVGTGQDDLGEKIGPRYDTPSLLYLYRAGPYLHHGKAKTLQDVLTTANKGDKHGKTSHLQPAAINDLVEFLRSLPYELPPTETPNTVKDRVPTKRE